MVPQNIGNISDSTRSVNHLKCELNTFFTDPGKREECFDNQIASFRELSESMVITGLLIQFFTNMMISSLIVSIIRSLH